MLIALKGMFDRRSTAEIFALGFIMLVAVVILDHITGFELSFSIFYLYPSS